MDAEDQAIVPDEISEGISGTGVIDFSYQSLTWGNRIKGY